MYNKVILIGNLTKDISIQYLPSGAALAKSSIATSYKYKTATGEQKDEVMFLDFNIFGKTGEVASQYLRKGSKVLLEGRLVLEQWTAQDGTNRSKHSLRVDVMKMLDSKSDGQQSRQQEQQQQNSNNSIEVHYQDSQGRAVSKNEYNQEQKIPEINIDEDKIPF